ncbi:hypothetical protein [Metabacillus iocasae]|uniref:Uncharacterized protein n=1 Tax=Priestia iocasae TaxID=2291674 RepID=A0ABS2QRJ8_9BACI|nr:hypothetical protein [Metabacillus iocasae]MBM7702069.1 hypothetical protein [Metabacillus iocasae]
MLTFEEKIGIIESFPQLTRNNVSLGRVNFHYDESVFEKKTVVYHLHPNGNGFVYGGNLTNYETNDKGFVNIRDFSEKELKTIIHEAIQSLSPKSDVHLEMAIVGDGEEERWIGPNNAVLLLIDEDDLWNIYDGLNLEAAFETYEEAEQYLEEEGFKRA